MSEREIMVAQLAYLKERMTDRRNLSCGEADGILDSIRELEALIAFPMVEVEAENV